MKKITGFLALSFSILAITLSFQEKGYAMDKHSVRDQVGSVLQGFRLVRVQPGKEVDGIARIYEHEKTGARLLYLSTADDNKVFSISFRTLPSDDTGVAHILEHSVLCGSRKFPSKEPFLELVKGSVKTFVNAMTFPDKTMYPVASRNDKDFKNLMDVYLDAVFFPKVVEDPYILKQEGWRYEADPKTGELSYNGVVFNEMKGVFSSPESVLGRSMMHNMYPSTVYQHESGGLPSAIPTLTHENFVKFYKKYYHPSNSYIYLYGNGNIEEHLRFVNEGFLDQFSKIKPDSTVGVQGAFSKLKEVKETYSINEGDSLKDKAFLALGYSIGKSTDPETVLSMEMLAYLLTGTEAAPLKRALLEAKVGKEIDGDFDGDFLQPVFSITAKSTNANKKTALLDVTEKTLKDLVKNGIDKKLIEAAINRKEFLLREADFRGYPKGLVYNYKVLASWLYEGDPLAHLQFEPVLKKIREKAFSGYFENLIQTNLLGNKHRVLVQLEAKPGLDKKRDEKVRTDLAKLKKSLSPEKLKTIESEGAELQRRQKSPDTAENLAKIPMLELSDLDRKAEVLPIEQSKLAGVPFFTHSVFTSQISYLGLYFDTTAVPQELLPYIPLLAEMLGSVDTEKRSFKDLTNELNIHTGGLTYSSVPYSNKDSMQQIYPKFVVSAKALSEKLPKLSELTTEVLLHSRFTDHKRLKEIIEAERSNSESALQSSGHVFASTRTLSYFSNAGKYRELTGGISYYQFLVGLEKNFEKEADRISENLRKVSTLIFNRNTLIMSYTSPEADVVKHRPTLEGFVKALPDSEVKHQVYAYKFSADNEALIVPSKVYFVAQGADFKQLGFSYSGKMRVLRNVLRKDYLWNRVRVQGGAYGAMLEISSTGNFTFTSYRDPNLQETYDIYHKTPEYLATLNIPTRELNKYILGTISELDMPLTPSMKGEKAMAYYISKFTQSDIQKDRDEVLATQVSDLKGYTELVTKVIAKDYHAVVGGKPKIEANKAQFGKVVEVLK
ncbi:insulinase family protein [Bdellovibrionota bacterium FG-2]